jgi:hypothetical protein
MYMNWLIAAREREIEETACGEGVITAVTRALVACSSLAA